MRLSQPKRAAPSVRHWRKRARRERAAAVPYWRSSLARSARAAGAAADNAEQRRPTMRGFKVAHCRLGKQLRKARARVALLFEQRHDIPKRVEICDLNERALVKLATERKHLTDIIKMVAYQAESDLLALLRPHYARIDQEGRTFCMSCSSDSELHITLAPLSSPHRTHAAHALCEMLDQTATIFPGSRLRFGWRCARHHVSGWPSPAPRSSAAPPRLLPRCPDRRRNRTFYSMLCQEV